jgi:hypothetical protein
LLTEELHECAPSLGLNGFFPRQLMAGQAAQWQIIGMPE